MTETLQDPLPPPPPPPPAADQHRLARDPDDRVVAGVCAGLGRYTATDPVLWRVTTGVLTVFGGAGIVLYALGWVLIPRTGAEASFAERTLRRPDRSVSIGGAILLGVLAVVLLGLLDLRGPALVSLVVIGGVVLLVARERRSGAVPPAPQQVWDPTAAASSYGVPPVGPDATTSSYATQPPPYLPPYVPPVPRERSVLGPLTLSVSALVAGVLLLLRELGVDGITAPRVLAAATLVVGVGLVVGTWLGRARWLALVGAGLLLVLVPTAALQGLEGGVGERSWVPQSTQQPGTYRLGVGEAVLDLRALEPGSVTSLTARVGAGVLIVLAPDDLRLRVRPDIGVGTLVTTGPDGRSSQDSSPLDDSRYPDVVLGPSTGSELVLDAEVGLGELEVRRVAS